MESMQLGGLSQDYPPRESILRARGTPLYFGNERVHREELFGSAYLMSETRVLQKTLKTGHFRERCNKNDARAESHGICLKKCPEVQDKGQPRSSLLQKHRQCLHPLG